MSASLPLIGAIEAGGTKFVLATGTGPGDLREVERVPTTTPAETLWRCVDYFAAAQARHGRLAALGIATFGPASVDPAAADWGFITTTPKPGWQQTDVAGAIGRALGVPVAFDTDVNGAALGEWLWGAGQGCGSVLYLTVGTGIGGGVVINGRPLHGLLHPEMGHIRIPHDRTEDPFSGACPWHGDCLEGLASGTAMTQRWGKSGDDLPPDHPAWDLESQYLAAACANFACTLSPHAILLGGGVMDHPGLIDRVREKTLALLNGYLPEPRISLPGLGSRAGLCGALALGLEMVAR